jgi:hypothetical protein
MPSFARCYPQAANAPYGDYRALWIPLPLAPKEQMLVDSLIVIFSEILEFRRQEPMISEKS